MTEDRELLAKFRAAQQGDYGQAQLRAILPKTLSDYSFVSTLVDALQAEHPAFVDEQRPLYAYLQQRYPMFSRLYLAWASLEASQDDDGRGDQRAKDILMKGMRVNSQPALDITKALSKLINRNLMLAPPTSQSEDKENAPWIPVDIPAEKAEPLKRSDPLSAAASLSKIENHEKVQQSLTMEQDRKYPIRPVDRQPAELSKPPKEDTNDAAAVSWKNNEVPVRRNRPNPAANPVHRMHLGRKLGPPLRTSGGASQNEPTDPRIITPPVSTGKTHGSSRASDGTDIDPIQETRQALPSRPAVELHNSPSDRLVDSAISSNLSAISVTPPSDSRNHAETSANLSGRAAAGSVVMPVQSLGVVDKLKMFMVNGSSYQKIELIGKGGSSKVYKIISPTGKIMALKRVKLKGLDQETIEGLKNEVSLLEKLDDERIIKLFDWQFVPGDSLLMLLEYGEIDLSNLMRKENTPNFIRMYWEQMLRAVHAIHQANVIHSDLKPANFLLVSGALKLIDFGIAKRIANDTTNIHRDHQTGTINYMSPEALVAPSTSTNGSLTTPDFKLGRSSDVWSLGCILYQLVYGNPPFAHLPLMQKLSTIADPSHVISYPPIPGGDNGLADEMLVSVMKSCLEFSPKKRASIPQLLTHPFITGGAGGATSQGRGIKLAVGNPGNVDEWGHVLVGIFEAIQQEYCKEADWDDKTAKRECVLKFLRKAVLGQRNA